MPEMPADDVPAHAMAASSAAQHHMTRAMNSMRMALEAEGFPPVAGVMIVTVEGGEGIGGVSTTLSFPVGEWDSAAELADEAAATLRDAGQSKDGTG